MDREIESLKEHDKSKETVVTGAWVMTILPVACPPGLIIPNTLLELYHS